MEEINKNDLLELIKAVEESNNGRKAKIISPEKYRNNLGDTFYDRRVEYSNDGDNLVLDINKLYVVSAKNINHDLS